MTAALAAPVLALRVDPRMESAKADSRSLLAAPAATLVPTELLGMFGDVRAVFRFPPVLVPAT
ncbi:hypothetical protein ESZ53_02270 [Salinibacterium sp. UTAS2018]|uniref:hypothetical protein n=1 Tax=Salinibacterium sp. UTAS2018 TaxID=2508880 RepID=UPI0010096A63|nr:hypothetical protein [Salinibacterium sp. UTAS2018]QAV69368.1 hypothetical protein ESZ53_02270 [Salinibacterium sp. UTAS2018]